MAAPDVVDAARALVHGRVKLCGLTREADVELAAQAGATHAGLIFVPGTPRAVTLDEARPLAAAARSAWHQGGRRVPRCAARRGGSDRRRAPARRRPATRVGGSERTCARASARTSKCGACAPTAPPARPGADRSLFDTGSGGTGQAVRLVAARRARRPCDGVSRGRDRARQRARCGARRSLWARRRFSGRGPSGREGS